MNQTNYVKIVELARTPEMQEKTVAYLSEHLKGVVEAGESVLVCLPNQEAGSLSDLMIRAVARCGGLPVSWGEDHRWKNLLRLAFTSRATTIIGTPRVILGLSKLKKAANTPLYIQNVVTAGYPCADWVKDGIRQGFDCRLFSVMGLHTSGVVAGFSCGYSTHLREEEYLLESPATEKTPGRWILAPKDHPELRVCPGEYGRIVDTPCPCGRPGIRMVDRGHWNAGDKEMAGLAEWLLSWTSVLACSLHRSEYGLELEMVIFPGEKLPKLPTCARQVIHPWDPEKDEPFLDVPVINNSVELLHSH